ncbi:MAG: twin-arginine translocase TatA/TatE family subunit [Chloroflexi bacterium]|nr:twin-arginine translocase TatA/TatE family subunit [Chloroflexota bacterium]MBM4452167.1 twin-arginine translocase TatA/TatE family subunit [Chloroflexota bacterium]
MPFGLHWPEIILILVIVLIIFGVGKLPQIGGAIGKSINEFRKARSGESTDDKAKDKELDKSSEADAKKLKAS